MRVRMTLLWLSLLTATAAGETAPACWMPSDLAYHKGDERVQKAVARIAPPQRMLAEFSPTAQRGAIRRVKLTGDKKLVALTFDLCEQPSEISGYQGGIVDFLRENRIKATFFMGGKWMLSHRERHAAADVRSAVRSRKPHLGTPEPAGSVGTGARRRNQECA